MVSKKNFLCLLVGLSVFVFLAAPLQASACWPGFGWACGIGDDIIKGIAHLIVSAITITTGLIFFLVAGLTNYIIDIAANITVSPSGSSTPDFVEKGWEFSRNFVNIFFLVILVFIGLATILRLREYELQRTLPRLILIVLLVNFSGLLVGFLADIGNIFTIFFTSALGNLGGEGFNEVFTKGSDVVNEAFKNSTDLASGFATALGMGIALAFFFLFATLAYLAIAVVFFTRLVILWTLVILAPFAFLAYILPATRGMWNKWFSALTQWAFITVPLAFFMWLANNVLNNPILAISGNLDLEGNVSGFSGAIGAMLSPFVAIVLLFIGLGMSASMSGSVRAARRFAGRAAAVGVGVLGGKVAYDALRKKAAESGTLRRMENMSAGQGKTRAGRAFSRVPGVAAGARFAGRQARGRATESAKKNINDAETAARDQETDTLVSKIKGRISETERTGYLNAIIKRGDIDDAKEAGLTDKEIKRIRGSAQSFGQHRDIDAAMPHFTHPNDLKGTSEFQERRTAEPTKTEDEVAMDLYAEQLGKMRPERARQVSREAFNDASNPHVVEAMVRGWDDRHVRNAFEHHGRAATDALEKKIYELTPSGEAPIDWLERTNPQLAKYAKTQAGQGVFNLSRTTGGAAPSTARAAADVESELKAKRDELERMRQRPPGEEAVVLDPEHVRRVSELEAEIQGLEGELRRAEGSSDSDSRRSGYQGGGTGPTGSTR